MTNQCAVQPAEDPVGFGLHIIDLKIDPCRPAPLFSMSAVITEPAGVETHHGIRACEHGGIDQLLSVDFSAVENSRTV